MPLSYTLETHSSIKSELVNEKNIQILKISNNTSLHLEVPQQEKFMKIIMCLEKCGIPSAENSYKPIFQPVVSTVKFNDLQINNRKKKESVEGALELLPPFQSVKFKLHIKPEDEDDVASRRKLYRWRIIGITEHGLEQSYPSSTHLDIANPEHCFFLYNGGEARTQLNIGLAAFGFPQIPITTSVAANNDGKQKKRARVGSSSMSKSKRQKTNTKTIKATAATGSAPFLQHHGSPPAPPPSIITPKPPYSTNIPWPALNGSPQAASTDPGDMHSISLLLQQLPLSLSIPNIGSLPALPTLIQSAASAGNAVASLSKPPDRGPSAHCWHPTASHHDDNIQWHSQASPAPFSTTSHSLASRAAVEEQKQREALCPLSDPPNYMMDLFNDDTEPLSFLDTAKPSTSVASLRKPPDLQPSSQHCHLTALYPDNSIQDTQSNSTSTTLLLACHKAAENQQGEEPYTPFEPPNEHQGSDGSELLRFFHNNTALSFPHNTAFQIEAPSPDESKEPPSPPVYPSIEQQLLFKELLDEETKDLLTKICQPASYQMTPFN